MDAYEVCKFMDHLVRLNCNNPRGYLVNHSKLSQKVGHLEDFLKKQTDYVTEFTLRSGDSFVVSSIFPPMEPIGVFLNFKKFNMIRRLPV